MIRTQYDSETDETLIAGITSSWPDISNISSLGGRSIIDLGTGVKDCYFVNPFYVGSGSNTNKLWVIGNNGSVHPAQYKIVSCVNQSDVGSGLVKCFNGGAAVANCAACGSAAKDYNVNNTTYSGDFCAYGVASPTLPTFPELGGSTNWTCNVGGTSDSCTATRKGNCTGTQPLGEGVLKGEAIYDYGSILTSWTYTDSEELENCEWTCLTGYEKDGVSCTLPANKSTKKEGSKNAIVDFKTIISSGKVVLNFSCLYDLIDGEQEIITINLYKNGANILLAGNEFECSSSGNNIELMPETLFEENTKYSVVGRINSVCEVCEREVFFYYVAPKKESAIPDSNFLSIIAFLSAMLFLMYKKRI